MRFTFLLPVVQRMHLGRRTMDEKLCPEGAFTTRPSMRLRQLVACMAVFTLFAPSNDTEAAITIHTSDGRILTGEVDEQTNANRLWLRQEKENILLTCSIAWNEITFASNKHDELDLQQLPKLLPNLATRQPVGFLIQQASGAEPFPYKQKNKQRLRIRSLEVDAFVVNLDRDVEPDGLQLSIAPIDEYGNAVPVKGSLSARLWGERLHPHGSLQRYQQVEQWSQRVEKTDFADGVANYRLRFRKINPEIDVALHAEALVNVRLSVFGVGNFQASVPVLIRPFNPVRDRLQLTRGVRFLPNELTENVLQRLPSRTNTRTITRRIRTR